MSSDLARRIEGVRSFSRFYTRQLGLLREGLLETPFALPEARVIHQLAREEESTATELADALDLDTGYLSRLLRALQDRGIVERRRSQTDARRHPVSLTERGREAFAELDAASSRQIERWLSPLEEADQERLVRAMDTVRRLLDPPPEPPVPYILRPHRPGDMGWVVHRHGVLYNREYGWDERFEALVADIVARFVRELDPRRERCWIAEREGENVGSVFLVRHPERADVARLRLLLVEPSARGLGIGGRLVRECTGFARQAGYRGITLWTNSILHAARRIYQREGYALVDEAPHRRFGPCLVGQTWELEV